MHPATTLLRIVATATIRNMTAQEKAQTLGLLDVLNEEGPGALDDGPPPEDEIGTAFKEIADEIRRGL